MLSELEKPSTEVNIKLTLKAKQYEDLVDILKTSKHKSADSLLKLVKKGRYTPPPPVEGSPVAVKYTEAADSFAGTLVRTR